MNGFPFHLVDMAVAQAASGLRTFKQSGLPVVFQGSYLRGPDFPHESEIYPPSDLKLRVSYHSEQPC